MGDNLERPPEVKEPERPPEAEELERPPEVEEPERPPEAGEPERPPEEEPPEQEQPPRRPIPNSIRELIARRRRLRNRWKETRCPSTKTEMRRLGHLINAKLLAFSRNALMWEAHVIVKNDFV
ncbi:hypothetical protein PYW07_015635 [Mythimna separata]|uniref:Uncharacterized protein n=1 Tax=Mythimna separata TaxID=271217 RepID=A0AAD8DZ63_MYTSE|nr:hypothetical protein PYW07_015635 [Mythimna separata]